MAISYIKIVQHLSHRSKCRRHIRMGKPCGTDSTYQCNNVITELYFCKDFQMVSHSLQRNLLCYLNTDLFQKTSMIKILWHSWTFLLFHSLEKNDINKLFFVSFWVWLCLTKPQTLADPQPPSYLTPDCHVTWFVVVLRGESPNELHLQSNHTPDQATHAGAAPPCKMAVTQLFSVHLLSLLCTVLVSLL